MTSSKTFISVKVKITVSYLNPNLYEAWQVLYGSFSSLKESYFLDVCYGSLTLFHLCGFCASANVFINDLPDLSKLRSHWLLEGAVLDNSITGHNTCKVSQNGPH